MIDITHRRPVPGLMRLSERASVLLQLRGRAAFRFLLMVSLMMIPAMVPAADRHVFLDSNGDGQLNDCPNPAHNGGAAGSSAELFRCVGGSSGGRLIGAGANRVEAGLCSGEGGTVVPVASGDSADVDGDGTQEPIYGHPQACVWNMARSDSCEVHAGTYNAAGAQCDEDCANQSLSGLEGALGVCDKYDCFQASVVALGDGPNMDGSGYGTAENPGYLRAADMNGSVDSWDPDGDKNPDDGLYAAIISGDHNGNGVFDKTTCADNSCSGDSFYGVMMGCGGPTYGRHFCRTDPEPGTTFIRIDSDADGSFDQNVGQFNYASREVHHLRVRDLVFTRYNGGNGGLTGSRPKTGTMDMNGGDGSTDGLKLEHIYFHDNDFTYALDDDQYNVGYAENHWAAVNDHVNSGCTIPTEIRDSFFEQNNARLLNFDCGPNIPCGCATNFHDNRVVVNVDPAKVGTYVDSGGRVRDRSVVVGYYKNIDQNPGQHRIWNNEFIVQNMGSPKGYFMDLQAFGNSQSGGEGELWVYGNIFRDDPAVVTPMKRLWQTFCGTESVAAGSATDSYRFYFFNNTLDMNVPLAAVCSERPGERVVERNNAFLRLTDLYQSTAGTVIRDHNLDSTVSADRAAWFDPGNYQAGNPGVHQGVLNYLPRIGGPLAGAGLCDPDGDGAPGVDWDWDGIVDTSWRDLGGGLVSCATLDANHHIGALQAPAGVGDLPPENVLRLRRTDTWMR